MSKKPDIDIVLADLDENDIGSILRVYNDANEIRNALEQQLLILKDKLKTQLKERKWDSYMDDESKISVSITRQPRESVNKKALKMLLNEEQYAQVITKTSSEIILVVNPKDRERLKNYGKH